MTQEAQKNWNDMTFEEKLQAEKEYINSRNAERADQGLPPRPYVIFRKTEQHDAPAGVRARTINVEVPFVFYLDGCHGDVSSITRFERRGWPIVDFGHLRSEDKEIQEQLTEVKNHIQSREVYMNMGQTSEPGILKKKRERAEASSNA